MDFWVQIILAASPVILAAKLPEEDIRPLIMALVITIGVCGTLGSLAYIFLVV